MSNQYTYLKKIKVPVAKLQLGMYISQLDKPWEDSPFLFQGFPIDSEELLNSVKNECEWVEVEFPCEEDYENFKTLLSNNGEDRTKQYQEMLEELPRAKKEYDSSSLLVKNIMRNIIKDDDFDLEPVQNAVKACVDSILHNSDALMLLTNIKDADAYTAEHCLRVSIMAIAFAKFLELEENELEVIGIGAMLHDVGKMRIPHNILNKPGRLSPAEYNVMQDHAEQGFKILQSKKHLSPDAIEIARSHHERLDGEGYPQQLKQDQISLYTKIVSIVDTFDAITSKRVYSEAESPSKAFKVILDNSDKQFDAHLAKKFVEWMGVYPIGSVVEMKTGELGVVTQIHSDKKLKPRVYLFTDENKQTGYEKSIDLARMVVHSSGETYQIKKLHPHGAYDIDVTSYINKGFTRNH
ncbi:HD-GYP domain-containing protein [Aliikangiella sp. IMCC44653]